tara:strand:+ start:169 stop:381 length:213 start_codon:yes stop_codon:yes gene_type:complete
MMENSPRDTLKAYRFLNNADDVQFCPFVSNALRDGYVFHGPPLLQGGVNGNRHCGQAVVLLDFGVGENPT